MPFWLTAVGLGIAFCALPGAVTAQAIRRGIEHGFFAALLLQLGALIGVALWAVVALLSAATLLRNRLALGMFGAVGSVVLFYLMWRSLRDAYFAKGVGTHTTPPRGDVALGAALSLINPGAIGFWLGVGATFLAAGRGTPDLRGAVEFLGGFLLGALLWCCGLAGMSAWGRRFLTPLLFRLVNVACGLALGVFAFHLVWSTLMALLRG